MKRPPEMGATEPAKLYTPVRIGDIELSHRVVMAPLTRMRSAQPGDLPTTLMAEYYRQRASPGGLIVAEGTTIAVNGRGYIGAPGIYSDTQIGGWQLVTDAVHAKGGFIFLQLWHVGRTSHVTLTGGSAPIAPSVVPYEGTVCTAAGWVPASPARALALSEIPELIEQWRAAARRAQQSGFDGVEIHGANGYLIDQFLQDGSNRRSDAYGGPVENRARLLNEVCEAVVSVWGAGRVGVRLSPSGSFNDMHDSDPDSIFAHAAACLNAQRIAYVHVIEPRIVGVIEREDGLAPVAARQMRRVFQGPIIAAGGFDRAGAETAVEQADADLVAFGRFFIANPDLPHRLRIRAPLNTYDRGTFYGGGAQGYTDYPMLAE